MNIRVKLFAGVREIAGTGEIHLTLAEHATAEAVLDDLEGKFPRFREWRPYLKLAVNHRHSPPDLILNDNDEVAVLPPVSGG